MLPAELVELRLVPGVDETTRSLELSLLVIGRRRRSAADLEMSLSAMAAVRALCLVAEHQQQLPERACVGLRYGLSIPQRKRR